MHFSCLELRIHDITELMTGRECSTLFSPVEIHAVAGGAGGRGGSVLPPHPVVGVAPLVTVGVQQRSNVPVN